MPPAGRKGNPEIAKAGRTAKVPRHLADMRSVYERDDAENDTPAQRPLRLMKVENFEKFLRELNAYERDWKEDARKGRVDRRAAVKAAREERDAAQARALARKAAAPAEAEGVEDKGTMAALELVEKLLKEVG